MLLLFFVFTGCSVKEFNAGVDSITSDIATAFNNSKDNGSKSNKTKDDNSSE